MLKLLGCVCVLCGGFSARCELARAERRDCGTLHGMELLLRRMEQEIALSLTPLPELFALRGFGAETDAFAAEVGQALRCGVPLGEAWGRALLSLPLREEECAALAPLAQLLDAQEEQTRHALRYTAGELARLARERERQRRERDRLASALCLSASVLVCIVLL